MRCNEELFFVATANPLTRACSRADYEPGRERWIPVPFLPARDLSAVGLEERFFFLSSSRPVNRYLVRWARGYELIARGEVAEN